VEQDYVFGTKTIDNHVLENTSICKSVYSESLSANAVCLYHLRDGKFSPGIAICGENSGGFLPL
jgi:hypothetical protein